MKKEARANSKASQARRRMGARNEKAEFESKGVRSDSHPPETESPFAKYQGIGNPGLPRGRKAIIRYIRKMRGE